VAPGRAPHKYLTTKWTDRNDTQTKAGELEQQQAGGCEVKPSDAAQVEALRLAELKDRLNDMQKPIYDLAYAEIFQHQNQEVGTQIYQAQQKILAAIQTINWQLRAL
jgi:TolA-binding protein